GARIAAAIQRGAGHGVRANGEKGPGRRNAIGADDHAIGSARRWTHCGKRVSDFRAALLRIIALLNIVRTNDLRLRAIRCQERSVKDATANVVDTVTGSSGIASDGWAGG